MNRSLKSIVLTVLTISCGTSYAVTPAPVCYKLSITTAYTFNDQCGVNGCGSPDTGMVTITNTNTTSTFTGNVGIIGAPNNLGTFIDTTQYAVSLAPNQSISMIAGGESSNQGGFNGNLGLGIYVSGYVTSNKTNVSKFVFKQIFDKDIHSGVMQTNPFGFTTDAYVLEGGDPYQDTGDAYETAQSPGHANLSGCIK